MTPKKAEYVCIREKQVNRHEVDIAELKTKANHKEEAIHEVKKDMRIISDKLDNIDRCINDLKLQSERDDFNIDTRVTKLETAQNTLQWVIGLGLTAVGTAVAVLAFILTHVT